MTRPQFTIARSRVCPTTATLYRTICSTMLPSVTSVWSAKRTSIRPVSAAMDGINRFLSFGRDRVGRLLQRGLQPQALLYAGFATMSLGTMMAFGLAESQPLLRYAGVLLFSMVGGMIPGTLFSLAVRLAPGDDTISTTVGWMQQWSAAGQFAGPPLVAWVASRAGGWQATWLATGACSLAGLWLAVALTRSSPR